MLENGFVTPWTRGKPCRHKVNGNCRLAAAIAQVPKEQTPVTELQCQQCTHLFEPTIKQPNEIVAELANKARANSAKMVEAAPLPSGHEPDQLPCQYRSARPFEFVQCRPCQNEGLERLPIYHCKVHERCAIRGYAITVKNICLTCDQRMPPGTPKVKAEKQEQRTIIPVPGTRGLVFNRKEEVADEMIGVYAGAACFLVCGGPSVADMDLTPLEQRGVFVAAVSQIAATHVRPHAWFSVDQARTYHEAIWKDPQIMKFLSYGWLGGGDDEQYPVMKDGQWRPSGTPVSRCPNVWFYKRGDEWDYGRFLTAQWAMWRTTENNGRRSVMLVALRLLHWLGFSRVYLIGCDFEMWPGSQYAFPSQKGMGAARSNNETFAALNTTFEKLRPEFERAGFHVFNATPGGKLEAFERLEFKRAVDHCRAAFPKEIDVTGLYH